MIDLDQVRDSITDDTVTLIYNDLQNPISANSSAAERETIAALAVEHALWVPSDEAYNEVRHEVSSTSIATLQSMPERTVLPYTLTFHILFTCA